MDNTTKFFLFLDCHVVVLWTAISGMLMANDQKLWGVAATFLTAGFMHRLMSKVITVYARATINGIIAYAETIKEDTPE